MLVELTPRSAEIIAREQAEHGAVSPEQLIEQALEAYSIPAAWLNPTIDQIRAHIDQGLADADNGNTVSADEAWAEIDRALEH